MLPAPGDKITTIDGEVHRGVVDGSGDGLEPGYFRWHTWTDLGEDRPWAMRAYREDTEGLSWIRGWHEEGSEELNALLAANKLQASAPSALTFSATVVMTMSGTGRMAKRYEPTRNPAFDFDPR